jgi:hypothetical protein
MRRLTAALAALILCAILPAAASATDITVVSFTIPNYQSPGTTAYLRVYYTDASGSVIDSLGRVIPTGAPGSGLFFKEVACTVNTATHAATCPAFTLASTTDSSRPTARAHLLLYNASRVKVATLFADLIVSHTLGATVTVTDLEADTRAAPAPPGGRSYTSDAVDARIASALSTGAVATTGAAGRVRMSVAPVDPAAPVAVGDNDPRLGGGLNNTLGSVLQVANPGVSGNNTNRYALGIDAHYDSSTVDTLFGHQTGLQSKVTSYRGQNDPDATVKQSFFSAYFDGEHYAAGQRFAQSNYVRCHGMGDCFAFSNRLDIRGGLNAAGDEGMSYLTSHMHHGDTLARATISAVRAPATVNTALTQSVARSAAAQAVTVASTAGVAVGDWVVIDRGITGVTDTKIEAVRVTAVGAGTITGVFRHAHSSGAPVTPATVLTLSTTANMGELRPLINLSATSYTTGTAQVLTSGSSTVTGSGTSWSNAMVGGDATLPGYLSFTLDDFVGTTPTGGNFTSDHLKSWYPITGVTSGTTLTVTRRDGVGTVNYSGNAVATPGGFTVRPCARILAFDQSSNASLSNTVVLETNSFTWTAGQTVENAHSVNNEWSGELLRMTPLMPGGTYRYGRSVLNLGAETIDVAFYAGAQPGLLTSKGKVPFSAGLGFGAVGTGITFGRVTTSVMNIPVFNSTYNGDINWTPSSARIGYDHTAGALYINGKGDTTGAGALAWGAPLSGATIPTLTFKGNFVLDNNATGETAFLRFKDQVGSVTVKPSAFPISGNQTVTLPSGVSGAVTVLAGGVTDTVGAGAPAGACTTGSTYRNTSGGAGTSFYVCESSAWAGK